YRTGRDTTHAISRAVALAACRATVAPDGFLAGVDRRGCRLRIGSLVQSRVQAGVRRAAGDMAQEPGRGPGTLKSWHGRQAARAIFDMKPRPSAVVCDNGAVAFGVPHELGRMGKRGGKALAVAGRDDVV